MNSFYADLALRRLAPLPPPGTATLLEPFRSAGLSAAGEIDRFGRDVFIARHRLVAS